MLEHRNKFPSSFHRRYDGSSNGSINDEQTMACARRRAFEHRFGRAVAQKRVRGSYEVNSCVRGVDAAVATAHEAAGSSTRDCRIAQHDSRGLSREKAEKPKPPRPASFDAARVSRSFFLCTRLLLPPLLPARRLGLAARLDSTARRLGLAPRHGGLAS